MNAKKTIAALHNENYELKNTVSKLLKLKENQDSLLLILFNDVMKIKLMKDFKEFQKVCSELLEQRGKKNESK